MQQETTSVQTDRKINLVNVPFGSSPVGLGLVFLHLGFHPLLDADVETGRFLLNFAPSPHMHAVIPNRRRVSAFLV
jgi:hypothetical protein